MASLSQVDLQPDPGAALWARLADQRLRLRDTVSVHPHRYRGRLWFLLRDTLGKQQFRLSRGIYDLVARLDGRRTLAEALAGDAHG